LFFFVVWLSLLWKVLRGIITSIGEHSPSQDIYDDNIWHSSNYGLLAQFIMKKIPTFTDLETVQTVVFNLAETLSNHKLKFEEVVTQGIFNITKSYLKAQHYEKQPAPQQKSAGVIKKVCKIKTVRKTEEFDVAKITKKMMMDVVIFCSKTVKNQALVSRGLSAHVEPLVELDILK